MLFHLKTVVYDRAGRISTITDKKATTTFATYTYTRDLNGQPTSIVATGTNVAGTRQFTYDTANRLSSVCYVSGTCTTAQKTIWAYDTVGNRASETTGSTVTNYTYDNADQLITSVLGTTTTNYTYDANGNRLTAGTVTNTYNTARQTVSVQDGVNPATTYTYDGNGNRATATTGAAVTRYRWDTNAPLANLAIETDTANNLLRRYTHGLEPLSATTPTSTSWYLTDELGSITHLTSPTGNTQWAYTYNPYGTTRTTANPDTTVTANPIKYTGQYQDPNSNYNLRARLYNPATGTFTRTDPLENAEGTAYMNAYAYAGNMPTVMIDPTGLRQTHAAMRQAVPLAPRIGKVKIDLFIAAAMPNFSFTVPGRGGVSTRIEPTGNGRKFDPNASLDQSKGHVVVDFTTGQVTFGINETCWKTTTTGEAGSHSGTSCLRARDANITTAEGRRSGPKGAGNKVHLRTLSNTAQASFTTEVSYDLELAGSPSALSPNIDGVISMSYVDGKFLRVCRDRDDFPSLGVYRDSGNGWTRLLEDSESPLGGVALTGLGPADTGCRNFDL